jgi:hypothetical protein
MSASAPPKYSFTLLFSPVAVIYNLNFPAWMDALASFISLILTEKSRRSLFESGVSLSKWSLVSARTLHVL